MSTALAPAAALHVIAKLIDRNVASANLSAVFGGAALTTCVSPDLVPTEAKETDHLNLFLYSVAVNPGWRNVELPMRDSSGNRIARPPLPLDLHFMMSAYGQSDFHPEMLLGLGMQALHETSFLDRGYIETIFATASGPTETAMATSLLDQQVEQITIAPHDLSADDLYKLWSAFGSKCRPSAAYVATVVLIESTAPLTSALPVHAYNLDVLAYTPPQITSVVPMIFQLPVLPSTQQLTLTGQGLIGPGISALFNGAVAAPLIAATIPNTATVTVPTTLTPGVNLVEIVDNVTIGPPPAKQVGASASVAFAIQPTISAPIVVAALSGGAYSFTVDVWPSCETTQNISLLLDELPATPSSQHYRIDAMPENIGGATIVFTSDTTASQNQVVPGTYLARLSVDNIQSVPTYDPVLGYTGPTVTV